MSIVAWLVLGLIAGYVASKIVNNGGQGIFLDCVLGVIGSFVGGLIFNMFGAAPITGLNVYSLIVAVFGAIVVLFLYYAITGRRTVKY